MKNFYSIFGIAVIVCALGQPTQINAQSISSTDSTVESVKKSIQLQGLVTGRKKYSFTVKQNETEYTVRLGTGAPIGLKMNRPWFDWDNDQVVVDAINYPSDATAEAANSLKRVAMQFPSKKLFLISRLGDAARMKEIMSTEVKRINFYLLTPIDPGQHFPTADQPYLSGALSVDEKNVRLDVNEKMLPVKLGFRNATMNGFSITELEPNKTQVFLSGIWIDGGKRNPGEQHIVSTRNCRSDS